VPGHRTSFFHLIGRKHVDYDIVMYSVGNRVAKELG